MHVRLSRVSSTTDSDGIVAAEVTHNAVESMALVVAVDRIV